jgi:hypothetical protein
MTLKYEIKLASQTSFARATKQQSQLPIQHDFSKQWFGQFITVRKIKTFWWGAEGPHLESARSAEKKQVSEIF